MNMGRSDSTRRLACSLLLCSLGCSGETRTASNTITTAQAPANSGASVSPAVDPVAQLRAIMESGKQKIPADKASTLVRVDMDVVKTSSLVVPYVGQILSEWDDGSKYGRGLIVVYYKYENNQWQPVWVNRGASGGVFPGTLREGKALMREDGFDPPPEFIYPWSPTTTYRIKAWDPSSP